MGSYIKDEQVIFSLIQEVETVSTVNVYCRWELNKK